MCVEVVCIIRAMHWGINRASGHHPLCGGVEVSLAGWLATLSDWFIRDKGAKKKCRCYIGRLAGRIRKKEMTTKGESVDASATPCMHRTRQSRARESRYDGEH